MHEILGRCRIALDGADTEPSDACLEPLLETFLEPFLVAPWRILKTGLGGRQAAAYPVMPAPAAHMASQHFTPTSNAVAKARLSAALP